MRLERIKELRRVAGNEDTDDLAEALDEIDRLMEYLERIAEWCHGDMAGQAEFYAKDALRGEKP